MSAAARQPAAPSAGSDAAAIKAQFRRSVEARRRHDRPYLHFLLADVFPPDVARTLNQLPFQAADLSGVSGKRELHNDQRHYFDAAGMARFPAMAEVAAAFQAPETTRLIREAFEAPIDDTFLRLEYAQDVDGFWLEPHTDLGVKKFTCLIYLSDGPGHVDLGTDIYASRTEHVGAPPFIPNTALIFVPGDDTWHGFEKRPITGVRQSIILNYVTHEWRAREQLSFKDTPVRV